MEKEDTWEKLEYALLRFAAITRGGGYKVLPLYVEALGRGGSGTQIVACVSTACQSIILPYLLGDTHELADLVQHALCHRILTIIIDALGPRQTVWYRH